MSDTRKPVLLVIGAGAGIGGNTAAHFAAHGYHAVLARRSDEAGLQNMIVQIEAAASAEAEKAPSGLAAFYFDETTQSGS